MSTQIPTPASAVAEVPHGLGEAASPEDAARHFASQLAYETDCWDVSGALRGRRDSSCSTCARPSSTPPAMFPAR
jgi:hypothetical protein